MIEESNTGGSPMRNFTAYLKDKDGNQRRLDLMARDLVHAMTSANYLAYGTEVLQHVVEQGDW